MGAPNYWEGPSITSVDGHGHCPSFVQGMELLKMLHRRIEELREEMAAYAPDPAPMGLQGRLAEVVELLEWMRPVEEDEQFGTQFSRIYREWKGA